MANSLGACLSCGSPLCDDIVHIGDQYPSAIYPNRKEELENIKATSLNLTICSNESCALVQLAKISELDEVFARYPYQSASTATMKGILQDVAQEAESEARLSDSDNVLDIGGNDGTLLSFIQHYNHRVCIDIAKGIPFHLDGKKDIKINEAFTAEAWESIGIKKPKLITSVAMFYHLSNPVEFCQQVVDIMDDESLFCMQMTYFETMVANNVYDNIVHEHRGYYNLHSLNHCFKKVGLHIVGARVVDSYGGSIRVYASRNPKRAISAELSQQRDLIYQKEMESGYNSVAGLTQFNRTIQQLKTATRELIDNAVSENGPLVGLGASTKGNMILQFLDVTEKEMTAVYDNSEIKVGTYLVGSGIPILHEKELSKQSTRQIMVLPYYYIDFFKSLLSQSLLTDPQDYKLLTPLPHPQWITLGGR